MGQNCGTCLEEDKVNYQKDRKTATKIRPTVSFTEITGFKSQFYDKNDMRNIVRNSVGEIMNENSDLEFDLRYDDNVQLLKKLCDYVLPDINEIRFRKPQKKISLVNKFLKCSFPGKVDVLTLDTFKNKSNYDIGNVINNLVFISQNVAVSLWLGRFSIHCQDLITILESFPHLTQITFHNCNISNIEECGVDLKTDIVYNYKHISFQNCGSSINNDDFAMFLAGVSETNMRETIEVFNINGCDAERERVFKQIKGNQMNARLETSLLSKTEGQKSSAQKNYINKKEIFS
ncbi:unnamed protein product [Moneuplotes crassus]|uniref:Uncharacterized protein n=1 Tax=Euplotes crassus TaxID=5936 RepID=A0AAD1XT73_EUPCR|nr:unnamed protein product [Moneuplotes crassus]